MNIISILYENSNFIFILLFALFLIKFTSFLKEAIRTLGK